MTDTSPVTLPATLDDRPAPALVTTRLGPIELAEFGHGPAVLCLHGAMGGFDQGLILARTLGESGYRYLAPSRPGYLGTPLARGRSPEEQADLYAALLDTLGIERTAVMAVSGGGPSAIHFALRHAQRCWGLVLVSTPAGPVGNRPPLSFAVMKLLAHIPWFAASAQRKTAEHPERVAARSITNPELLARTMQNPDAWRLLQELQNSTMDRMARRLAGTDIDIEVTATRAYPLEDISVPTLVIQGTADPLVPFNGNGKVFAARVPGVALVALEGGGHAAIFSHRDEARAATTGFLRQYARREMAPGEAPGS
jgi:pimeloyl-ACP methyl ester carboxylesterase